MKVQTVAAVSNLSNAKSIAKALLVWQMLNSVDIIENCQTTGADASPEVITASARRRVVAFHIDIAISMLFLVPVAIAMGGISALASKPISPVLIFVLMLHCVFQSVMESRAGATFGKMALGLRIVDYSGNKISFAASFIRNFIKIPLWIILRFVFPNIPGVMLLTGLGQPVFFSFSIFTPKHQALYDYLAHSIVLRQSNAFHRS